MEPYRSQEDLIQNLKDAGCSEKVIADFLEDIAQERLPEGLRLLQNHRRTLLDGIHREQKRIDCLDYLVFMLQRPEQKKTGR